MHSYRRVVALVLATLPFFVSIGIHGQDLPAVRPEGTEEAKSYPLSGHVVNAVTGKPVSRVLIQIFALDRATLTDEQGDFVFDSVPAGRTELWVTKPGYFRADQPPNPSWPFEPFNAPYAITVGPDTPGLVLKLLPEAVIAGTVRGEDGEPLDEAVVRVEAADPHTNPRHLQLVRQAQLSNDGIFHISGLAPGRYYVSVRPPQQPPDTGETRYPHEVYFPSTDASGAAAIDLAPGQQRKVDFNLVRSATPVSAQLDASNPEQEKPVPESGPFQISGVVVDSLHGHPIPHAYVMLGLETKSRGSLTTDDDGRFSFSGLPAGQYTLAAQANHYPLQYLDQHDVVNSALAVVGPGLNTGSFIVRLSPECSFSGRVVDESHDPVRNAWVYLYRAETVLGRQRIRRDSVAPTDEEGIYHFRRLNPGKYFVAVVGRVWYAQRPEIPERSTDFYSIATPQILGTYPEDQGSTLDVGFPLTFYPGTVDPAAAAPILVAAGDQRGTDIVLHAVPALHLRVNMGTELLHPGAWVEKTSLDGTLIFMPVEIRDIASNEFDITGITPGRYTVLAGSRFGAEKSLELDVTLRGHVTLLNEVSAVPVRTKIQFEGDPPHDGQEILHLKSPEFLWGGYSARVSSSGEIVFDMPVMPGSYTLYGRSPEFIASVSATGAVINGEEITIEGNAPVELRVTLAAGRIVKGVAVRDGKPAQGALVLLVPPDFVHNKRQVHIDESNSDGTFSLGGVIPGKYTLLAIQNGWDLEWLNPALLAPYLSAGQVINVEPNGEYNERVNVQ